MERMRLPTRIALVTSIIATSFMSGDSVVSNISLEKISNSPPSKDSGSTVLYEYGMEVQKDMQGLRDSFTSIGIVDLSGYGYSACVVDPDCLAGDEHCVAGTKPNAPQAPGYCISK